METIKDIVRELRELGASSSDGNIVIVACTIADRIEAAARRQTMLCLSACANMKNENAKLKAALKPVLECDIPFSMNPPALAVYEARRIYNEGASK